MVLDFLSYWDTRYKVKGTLLLTLNKRFDMKNLNFIGLDSKKSAELAKS